MINVIMNYECYPREDGCWLSVVAGWLGAWAGAAAGCNNSSGMPFTTISTVTKVRVST